MKKFIIALCAMFVASFAFSQSADFVTKILESPEATYGQVSYLVAVYQEYVPETASEEDAFKELVSRNVIENGVAADNVLNYAKAASLFSKIWKIKGSLMFTLTKGNPRYAFKQLRNDRVIPKKADPCDIPSGVDILNIFTAGNMTYGD